MIPSGPTVSSSVPKRFSATGRSLYTDPLAELQGKKEAEVSQSSIPNVLLPPPMLSQHAAFPVEGTNSPKSWHSSPKRAHVEEDAEVFVSEAADEPTELYVEDQVDVGSTDRATQGSEDEQADQLGETVPQLPATRIDLPMQEVPGSPSTNFALQQTPRSSLRVEISAIEHQLDQTAGFEEGEDGSTEISILGHPVGPPHVFPSEGRISIARNLLDSIKEDGGNVLAVQKVITQCLSLSAIPREDRAVFCQTIEAVSFHEGPLRDAAQEAVGMLIDCLEEEEGDAATASAALGALWNLSFSPDRVWEDAVLILEASRKSMLAFPAHAEVQGNASGILINLGASCDRSFQENMLSKGLVETVVSAVTRHRSNSIVVEHACQLLSMMAARKESRLSKDHVRSVLEIATKSRDPSVQRWAGWLANLSGL